MNYKCSSHQSLFQQDYSTHIAAHFHIFPQCQHSVCFGCIQKYITDIFERVGLNHNYVCPGCHANYSQNPTPLDTRAYYFTHYVSLEIQEEWKIQNDIRTMTIKQGMTKQTSRCFFFKFNDAFMNCPGIDRSVEMPECRHKICRHCIEKSFATGNQEPPFKCFVQSCATELTDEFIKGLLISGSHVSKIILPKLRIPEIKLFYCPNCNLFQESSIYNLQHICNCGEKLCPKCGQFFHDDLPCEFADLTKCQYQMIQCTPNDLIDEYRSLYYKALSAFMWDLHPGKKNELMKQYNIKFNILTVHRIINPVLQDKYNSAKARIMKEGIDPLEKYVFHATQPQFYEEICKNGFKIGGIDVNVKIGQAYGYGIYTATDPTMSIYFYKNKQIILCKGLTGRSAPGPIKTEEEFKNNTEYHSTFIDFKGNQSNYYVFFSKDYLIPYYLITYE
jgi:hypothetical protein